METGKPELASVASHMSAVAAQTERRMEIQAPLTAVYIHTVPALPTQPALAVADPSALHLSMPPLYSKETLPFLTLHIAGGLQPGLSVTATPPAAKPKSAGKHLCPHCGRDCMKPSVLEKHLRCHTGERPYPCTVCGVSFKTQSNLYKHKRTQAHARLSSESEQSTVGSLDSLSRSTETASLFMDEPTDDSMGAERNASLQLLSPEKTKVATQTMDINDTNITSKTESLVTHFLADDKATKEHLPPSNRHVVLQRQEATLFSKQWDSAVSSKSKSHESTDSGFSESSEHYPSPGSLLPDHSMDSLTETSTEQGEDSNRQIENQEDKNATKEQENKSLEERISKLISQNSAVVEDKHLEHVRPRKTTLSKQGSIDLPLPYTYKDSFHFDMRISKLSNAQRNRRPVLYTSVPTQQSTSVEHTPLTRSNSLPFSVNLLQPDLSSPTTPSQRRDYSTLFRRGSSGQISQTSFSFKSVNQQSSNHRPLVRQAAVDCNNATEALCKNSSVDEACMSSPSSHGEAEDTCGDTSNRKSRRKKAQKFAYNKWYMYGGGTFKKLYDMEKGSENRAHKGAKSFPNSEVYHGLQKRLSAGHCETTTVSSPPLVRSATVHNLETAQFQLMPSASLNGQMSHILASPSSPRMPLRRNLSLSVLPLSFLSLTPNLNFGSNKTNEATKSVSPCPVFQSQVNVPSDRKKQRTDEIDLTLSQPHKTNMQPNSTQVSLFQTSTINTNPQPVASSPTTSVTTPVQKSFMPKYQLKLPNSQEPCSSTNSLSRFTPKEPTSISALPLTTTASYKSDSKQLSTYSSSNSSFSLNHSKPCNPTHINVISTAVHQCLVAETKTTTSLRNSHNSGQLSPKIRSPAHRSVVPTSVKNSSVSFTPIHRTQSSPAAFTTLSSSLGTGTSQGCSPSPLQPQMAIHSDTTEIPLQLVQGQQTIPKVFHVQTPDLQICFQILSDEQLALIEPQIEKQTSSRPLSSEQEPVTAERLKISSTADNTDKTTSHKHCMLNKELDTNNKDSAELSVCNKYESETVHTSKSIGQSTSLPTHPHICVQENKVRKLETSKEGEMLTPPKDTMLEKNIIPQRNLLCNVAAQDEYVPEVQKTEDELVAQASNGPNPSLATVTCTASPHPENNEGIKCSVKHTDICNDDLRYKKSNRKVNRNNLQASMVGLSLSQTNPTSEQTESSLEPEDEHVSSVSTGGTESTAVSQVPDFSAGSKEVSPVGRVEQPSHTGAPEHSEQSHVPLFTDRGGFTNIQLDTQQVEQARSRVDSFPNGWLAGQNCLHNFSQAQLGICEGPPQSSGTNSNLESNSIPAASNNFCNLPPTSQVKSDSMRTASVLSEGNPTEGPRCKTVSSTEVGCQESGLFQQQDQRLHCNDGNSLINYITYTSQSHDHKDSYQFNSSVYVTTPSQTNVLFSDHIRQDKLSLPCDRLLFGMGTPFSYPPGEPPSGAVRVVQSVVEAEDSSDDEGKLIIEL